MAVNYILEEIDPGSQEHSITGPAGQTMGMAESQNNVYPNPQPQITKYITPNPGYYVHYTMFNISGAQPGEQSLNGNTYFQGGEGVVLPPYIEKVTFSTPDYGQYSGLTLVIAFLDPNYTIPENLGPNFTIILDIDGDAALLDNPPADIVQPPVNQTSNFYITLMVNVDCNCSVVAFPIPNGPGDPTSSAYLNNAYYLGNANIDTDVYRPNMTSIVSGNDTGATSKYKSIGFGPGQNATPSSMLSNSGELGFWFWIVPDPGYTVSRHNFSVKTMGNTPLTFGDEGDINTGEGYSNVNPLSTSNVGNISYKGVYLSGFDIMDTQNLAIYPPFIEFEEGNIQTGWVPSGDQALGWGSWNVTQGNLDFENSMEAYEDGTQYAAVGNPVYDKLGQGSYEAGWYAGTVYNNAEIWTDPVTVSNFDVAENYDVTGITGDNLGVGGDIILLDSNSRIANGGEDISAQSDWWLYGYGWDWIDNGFPYSSTTGELPGEFCANDYIDNKVIVGLNGINTMVPGELPDNITIRIDGAAMLQNGDECVDYDIEIEEGDFDVVNNN